MAKLLKVHGSENKFFLMDQTELKQPLTTHEMQKLVQFLTDPKHHILNGADGLLVVNQSKDPKALAEMRIFNRDGSEASMCGNGLRTVSRYLSEKTGQDHFIVSTMGDNLHEVSREQDLAPKVPAFSVEIAPVKFAPSAMPLHKLGDHKIIDQLIPQFIKGLKFSVIAVPNPHLISFVPKIDPTQLGHLGKYLNGENPYFTDGVNVNFAKILGKNRIFVQTYERGVGFTNACGTGMSATSLAFVLTHPQDGQFNHVITVLNPGGMVRTKVMKHSDGSYSINLAGNATFTHQLTIPEADLHQGEFSLSEVSIKDTHEEDAYQQFVKAVKAKEHLN
ncbi:diaminopimelate epimerase [Acetilactobacillus jinshanensis]|uniref:Diaminopimelate epimerase n=1 Tax=Acetilactobacillus jinshanensis TaxID=1720083 RepID=A0A4P6ZKH4_9LACO|nr:diaminopimelate epimerase [Acetilactobacillus jinshanensis]QBP18158.1 diaminopimelate epimerase [Acetilactobacillus jinshanensis]URL61025.1 diaminopimelate epimerase [uncultured bacterium]